MTTSDRPTPADLLAALMPGQIRQLSRKVAHMKTTTAPLELIVADEQPITTTTPTTVEITIAADIGNGRTKIIAQTGTGRAEQIEMPTVRSLEIVFGRDILTSRGYRPDDWSKLGAGEHVLTFEGLDRFVGQLAVDHSRASSSGRGSDERYSDGTTGEFILAAIANLLPRGATFAARAATLLPIKLYDAYAAEVEKSLRKSYTYGYNGRDITGKIDFARTYREGEAAYHGLTKKPAGRAIIVDIGGRTVNVALFSEGQYRDGDTIDNMGVEAALDKLDRMLELDGLRRLTLAERFELQTAIKDGQSYSISHRQTSHRIDTRARKVFDATAATLGQELARHFKMDMAEAGAIVGGGGFPTFFGTALNAKYPVLELVDEPETRNVLGAYAQIAEQPIKKARKR